TLGFLTIGIAFLHRRGILPAIGIAALSILGVYVVFRLIFQVILPEGVVPEREILAAIGRLFSGGAE
ncbi:MAG TPA: tripartite tricarboxylate transporter TctB family protein, partial [Paracoccaceae bacterium]|nr:tripartite tricarboxylate transporter TctB family protein [Paracoccaceae bacterium]